VLQVLKDPKIDFMSKRHLWLGISAALTVAALTILAVRGIRWGIEFTGGTELQLRYHTSPDLGAIRSSLNAAGLANHLVTTIGERKENEIYVKIGFTKGAKEQQDLALQVVNALRPPDVKTKLDSGLVDLNVVDQPTLTTLLTTAPDLAREDAAAAAAAISERRKDVKVFTSASDIASIAGVKPEAARFLQQRSFVGPFAVRSQSYIGPAVGGELISKAMWAILGSVAGMLIYIWIRFQFQWGLGAIVATVHDTIMTLGLFSLFGMEMSLPVVAAFLTLVGYSTNDTVVIFDRIRENLRGRKTSDDLTAVINASINQTLSRTLITSGLTWITVLALFLFGGEALKPFSFVLVVGIIVGTYSSMYIASPILLTWKALLERRKAGATVKAPAQRPAAAKAAKKVKSRTA
jgi:preprotein translocase subunit SecF